MLRLLERKLTFKPNADDHGGLAGIEHERLTFGYERGLNLDGVFVRRESPSVVLFIHGNRHNITKFGNHYKFFVENDLSFMAFDFPGYGRSQGEPSEDNLYSSARAAHFHLTTKLGYKPQHIAVYGCSLGGAVAIEMLQDSNAACLVTESTFTSSAKMAKHLYPYMVFRKLLPNRFQNDQRIGKLRLPIFMVHGSEDRVVPCSMGHELLAAAQTDDKQLFVVPGADHVNCISLGGPELRSNLNSFIRRHAG